jgi:hypothetical protein
VFECVLGIESANKMIQTVEESNDSANRVWFFTDMEVSIFFL